MKIIKILLLSIIPVILFANVEYVKINHLESIKEGNLTRITKINNQTFEYFKLYMNNDTFNNLNEDCKVKFDTKRDDFTLSTGKSFVCDNKFLEFNNTIYKVPEKKGFDLLINTFYYEFLGKNLGKLLTMVLFFFTFIVYLMTHKGAILLIGIILSLFSGAFFGIFIIVTDTYPYNKSYLIKYYDDIEKENGYKVFRKGFYPRNLPKEKESE